MISCILLYLTCTTRRGPWSFILWMVHRSVTESFRLRFIYIRLFTCASLTRTGIIGGMHCTSLQWQRHHFVRLLYSLTSCIYDWKTDFWTYVFGRFPFNYLFINIKLHISNNSQKSFFLRMSVVTSQCLRHNSISLVKHISSVIIPKCNKRT